MTKAATVDLPPLPWPPDKRPGDKLVPVLRGSERHLYCVYLVSPCPDYRLVKVGSTDNLSRRLASLSGLTAMHKQGFAIDLFGTLWFQHKDEAKVVEAETRALLAARRVQGDWFEVPVAMAYQAVLVVAKKAVAPYLDYGRYVAACQWRKELPPDRRLTHQQSTKRELRAGHRRLVEAAELAAAVHGVSLYDILRAKK